MNAHWSIKLATAIAVGLAAGLAGQALLRHGSWPASGSAAASPAPGWSTELREPFAVPPALQAAVLVEGARRSERAGRVALPDGTRFELDLASNRSGRLELRAIDPRGGESASPMWTSAVVAGEPLRTPGLRLSGKRGLEILRVVLRAPDGRVLTEQDVQIDHF